MIGEGRGKSKLKAHNSEVRVLRASELGEYSYCSRAWWYRHVLKIAPSGRESSGRLEAGIRAHNRHGRGVALSRLLRATGIALALLGLLTLALAWAMR